jgi:MATE family multidrug resistance protein
LYPRERTGPNSLTRRIGALRAGVSLRERSLSRQVLVLALPAMGEQLLTMTVSIVDTILVGHLGPSALAAVSLANEWIFAVIILFWGVAGGATALVARSIGARDWETADSAVGQSMLIAVTIGLLASVAAMGLAQLAMVAIGASAEVMQAGTTYIRIVAVVFPLSALMYVGNACLRGAGDTRIVMLVMAVVNVLNIIVAWVAINGALGFPRLGIAGSALGAATGYAVGGVLIVFLLLRGRAGLRWRADKARPDFSMMRRILRVGVPAGVEQMNWRLGTMVFVRAIASLGTVPVAAHAVVLRAESLSYMPGSGFAVAGTTLVGQGLGAEDADRAERSGYLTYRFAAAIMALMGSLFILAPQLFIGLFTPDVAVIQTAIPALRITALAQPFLAAAMVFPGGLRGAGDTRFPMLVTSLSIWTVRVPLALLLALTLNMGLAGAWIGVALDVVVRGTVCFFRFRSGRWKKVEV